MDGPVATGFEISVRGLSYSYLPGPKGRPVLSNVSLAVEPGRVLSVLGTNGSGKSTLIAAIAGMIVPNSGIAEIAAREGITKRRPTVALLHQDYRQTNCPWASVLDNITYPMRFRHFQQSESRSKGLSVLRTFLPDVEPERPAYELSGGQQQLVAVARALACEPDVLLGDEPLSAVDAIRAIGVIQKVNDLWQTRAFPMIWISHNVDEALLLGDVIGLLSRRTHSFDRFVENPVPRPRSVEHLGDERLAKIRTEILQFLLEDDKGHD